VKRQRKKSRITHSIVLATIFFGCAVSTVSQGRIRAYIGYVNVNSLPATNSPMSTMRRDAIQQTASILGARGALAYRSVQVDHMLNKQSSLLDGIFNFNRLLLPHNILPPVIETSSNSMSENSNTSVRGSSKTYRLIQREKFVTVAPTWRDYLIMNYKKPEVPSHILLPQNRGEANLWNQSLNQGWKQGITQANEIFEANLNRLKRDVDGMILYQRLLTQRMISAPSVTMKSLGVTGNAQEININDYIKLITGHSQLQPDSRQWRAIVIH
jgi:defect in organelle trafficking protein DotC